MANKRILKIRAGSHLYGTSTPNSDQDYLGIFLNSKEELLGLQSAEELTEDIVSKDENGRNNKDAVDCKYYELRKFCRQAMSGNPTNLEILFVNPENIIEITDEGRELLSLKKEFISNRIYNSFMGYAISQKKKAFIKSENLRCIEGMYNWLSVYSNSILTMTFNDFRKNDPAAFTFIKDYVKFYKNERNDEMFYCGDLTFSVNILMKKFKDSLKYRLDKASWRKDGILQYGLDYKFMSHDIRLLLEGLELIKTQNIVLPLSYRDLIIKIKTGQMSNNDIIDLMQKYEDEFHTFKDKTSLPEKANYEVINNFIIKTYYNHLMQK